MLKKIISIVSFILFFNLILVSCNKETMNSIIENGKFQFYFKNEKPLKLIGTTSDFQAYFETYITFKIKDENKNTIFQTTELINVYTDYYRTSSILWSNTVTYGFSSLTENQKKELNKKLSNPSGDLAVEITASNGNGGFSTSTWSLYDNSASCFEYDSSTNSVLYAEGCLIKIILE